MLRKNYTLSTKARAFVESLRSFRHMDFQCKSVGLPTEDWWRKNGSSGMVGGNCNKRAKLQLRGAF